MSGGHPWREPMTPAQGRALFHLERLFRSTGCGAREHRALVADCEARGLDPRAVSRYTDAQCVQVMQRIELHARGFSDRRQTATGWQDFAPGGRFYRGAQ